MEILGYIDTMTKAQALQARARVLESVNKQKHAETLMTFTDVAKRFIEVRVPQLGVAVQKRYPSQIENHLIPYFGHMALSDIGQLEVETFCTEKLQSGLASWSVVGLKGVLSAVFTAARSWKLYDGQNPCIGVRVKKRPKRERRLITVEEFRTIIAALHPQEQFLVWILYGTGLRISEVLGLRWSDIDLQAGTLTVRRRWYRGDLLEETKSHAGARTLQLGSFLTDQFRRRKGESTLPVDFVFRDPAKPQQPPDDRELLGNYFRPIIKRLGFYYEGFGWHAFRRQNITLRQHFGATPLEAMRAAGHASLDMTLLYTLTDPTRERQQIDAMFAAIQ